MIDLGLPPEPPPTPKSSTARPKGINGAFVRSACARLREGKPIRRKIEPWGRVHVDRPLPFLVVYRRPPRRADEDTASLVVGEAAYLIAPGGRTWLAGTRSLVEGIAAVGLEAFGGFLVLEVWSTPDAALADAASGWGPRFRVHRLVNSRLTATISSLEDALSEIRIKGEMAEVEVGSVPSIRPPGMSPLLSTERAAELGVHLVGLELQPVFRSPGGEEVYPLIHRAMHKGISRAMKRAIYEFTRLRTSHRPPNYHALGRHSVVKAVWEVDRRLAGVSSQFDFILQVTPVNGDEAWAAFRRRRFEVTPTFVSRPLKLDTTLAKRELFKIPLERVEDPTLAQVFREQQTALDRKLTMLGDRGRPEFRYGSLQLYGRPDADLLAIVREILERVPSRSRDESPRGAADAATFAARVGEELAYYRQSQPEMNSVVEVRKDIVGLMVSRGRVLVGAETRVPASRVEALLAHEVGTHVVTYVNGRAQPFRQLAIGLPAYDELQEGFAVFAEYLAGGLGRPRLRLLAARVLAAERMLDGASFIEVFRELDRAHDFASRTAFSITMRVFRGGGLTKDIVYLRGLTGVLSYLRNGGAIEPLLIGKIGLEHVPIIEELQWRKVLVPPLLRPRHLEDPVAQRRLERARSGLTPLDLVMKERR